ncbi:hypothetical protein CMK11_18325 [Candidatus Poribacteria bacterium]|nr:hypothetical protein [Candidatus Poribacteria bacterium]
MPRIPTRRWPRFSVKPLQHKHAPLQKRLRNFNGVTVIADGTWHHVAMAYDMEMRRIYVDGVVDAEKPSANEPGNPGSPVVIGQLAGGMIDGRWRQRLSLRRGRNREGRGTPSPMPGACAKRAIAARAISTRNAKALPRASFGSRLAGDTIAVG